MKKILLSVLVLTTLLTNQKVFSQASCALNPDFSDPDPTKIVDGGSPGGGYEAGDRYVFQNVLTSPVNIYAEVHIEAINHAYIHGLDNNSTDPGRLQPFIASTSTANDGYVQFAVIFRKTSDNSIIPISQLRLTAFDVDGDNATDGSWIIRETVEVADVTSISFNSPTTLTDAGTAVSDGFTWRKIVGQAMAYNDPASNVFGLSNDPAHSFSAASSPSSVFRFRVGYTYPSTQWDISNAHNYSIELGCLVTTENVPLPLTLLNFSGSYSNNKSFLNWTTQSEVNVDRFEVERSGDGNSFVKVGAVVAKGGSANDYQLTEDVTNIPGGIFYYRLKSVDKDGKYTYSKVVALRKDTKFFNKISITPNPILNGNGIIKITTSTNGTADIKIVDFAGRIVMLQKITLFEGVNVLPVNGAGQLSAGVYSIQLFKAGEVLNSKFIVGR
jgi:hypothetical protein